MNIILYGTGDKQVQMVYQNTNGNEFHIHARLRGRHHQPGTALPRDQLRIHPREDQRVSCPTGPAPPATGKRLRPEAIAVTVDDANIIEVTPWPVQPHAGMGAAIWPARSRPLTHAAEGHRRAHPEGDHRTARLSGQRGAGLPDPEPLGRPRFQAARPSASASRRRSARGWWACSTCWMSPPSACTRAITTACWTRSRGCATWATPCWSSSMTTRPSATRTGSSTSVPRRASTAGASIAEGTPKQILAHPKSLTGAYLSGRKQVEVPKKRRDGQRQDAEDRRGARQQPEEHRCHDPARQTGLHHRRVSGSGKSTLMTDILYNALAGKLMGARTQLRRT